MDTNTIAKPIEVLTEEQAAQVAGGLVLAPSPVLGGGCRACTSGVLLLFQAEAASFAK
jgi:hypothetical protein